MEAILKKQSFMGGLALSSVRCIVATCRAARSALGVSARLSGQGTITGFSRCCRLRRSIPLRLGKQCAGPGMVPLTLLMSTDALIGTGSALDHTRAELGESDAEDAVPAMASKKTSAQETSARSKYDVKLDGIKVKGYCSSLGHRQATMICQTALRNFLGRQCCRARLSGPLGAKRVAMCQLEMSR